MIILQFRETFMRFLLFGMSFEKLELSPRQQSASHSKRKFADHINSKKRKDLRTMPADFVLADMRKAGNNNQEKRAWRRQRK